MWDDNKKKVALGTTLALLLGAGSYWVLGSGGGSDSDGLNSEAGKKIARARLSNDSGKKMARRRPASDRGRSPDRKAHRDHRVAKQRDGKTHRPRHTSTVIKKRDRKPQA